jgi:hypothetical protein
MKIVFINDCYVDGKTISASEKKCQKNVKEVSTDVKIDKIVGYLQ